MPEFTTPATGARASSGEIDSDTHGMRAVGAGGTAAGSTTVGSIVLPAGGPWKIFGLWGQIVQATQTAAEAYGGYVEIDATAGDVDPDPAPVKFPVPHFGSILGTTAPVQVSPLKIWPVTFTAPGKAALDLNFVQDIACTVAPQIAMGILFGKTVPTPGRFRYMDRVRTTVTSAADQAVGTITLAEKANKITSVCCILNQDGVLTAAEELIGTFRLDSDDIRMQPLELPASAAISAGLGATIGAPVPIMPVEIPVNIPVVGGARIDCYVDLNTAVTNATNVAVYIGYE